MFARLFTCLPPINFVHTSQTYVYHGPRVSILFQLHFCRYILAANPLPCIHIYMDTGPVPNKDHVPRATRLVHFSQFGTWDCRPHDVRLLRYFGWLSGLWREVLLGGELHSG
ncbi:hypothetical protein L211DRAFT_659556 [Terfezia boudieri ATCC MYA-4762]|uniref:Uncharacterized protein n=1 Tax=Terfezia boudieri ATCC MYA-4762 TaxID=1051890 RepID=A0A3N4M0F5_9PEZI|nr:hypothetical protein L211DRAFT_659556 [Terfezia boudieri ATCC MYA-4762]